MDLVVAAGTRAYGGRAWLFRLASWGQPAGMDHSQAPVLDALAAYHRRGEVPFTPPGHKQVCHARGRPLITDEAWGAHLPFHDGLPAWAMNAGADVCVTSVHKMGAGLEQSSAFHLQGDLVDPAVLQARADLLGTTSP
jgi:arginine/lysine/ornithine decarboxylase